jgi:hypothetical protein
MNSSAFKDVFDQTIMELEKLLNVKGGEYAGSGDRLGNFKRGAERVGIHPLQILWIYAAKHIDSIETFIRDTAAGQDRLRSEPMSGRFDDLINYCILAKALIREIDDAKQKAFALGGQPERRDRIPGSDGLGALPVSDVRPYGDATL